MTQEQRPTPEKEEKVGGAEEKVGWIDGLAKRSAGVGDGSEGPRKQGSQDTGKSPWSYAGIGLQFAATTALFALMGMYVDRQLGWSPWATVGCTMLGLIGGLYLLIKEAMKENADPPDKGRKKNSKDGPP